MMRNSVWLLAAALAALTLISLPAQAGDHPCGRPHMSMAGDCGDEGCVRACCMRAERGCCGECEEACRLDSAYKCRCHGDGCVLEGTVKPWGYRSECCIRFDCGGRRFKGCERNRDGCMGGGMSGRMHKGHHGRMGPMGLMAPELQQRMKLQGRVDRELRLSRCQEKRLSHICEANSQIEFGLMHRYFADRRVDIDQLNWQLTELHRKVDWHTRGQLNPMQEAVFPEHQWFNYCLGGWDEGFHPGADYVRDELRSRERTRRCRMSGRCWPEG